LTGVNLLLSGTLIHAIGDQFILVSNDATDAVISNFNGLPEGKTFTIPAGQLAGAYSITYHGGDGNDVVLTAVNTAPSFIKGPDQHTTKDSPPQSISAWATHITPGPSDEDPQMLHFVATSDNAGLFAAGPSINPSGTLTFTPLAGAIGAAHVSVVLIDDGGAANGGVDTSQSLSFTITVSKLHAWHNDANPLDVNADGHVAPVDALAIINFINGFHAQAVPTTAVDGPLYYDVNPDDFIAPNDALAIINQINAFGSSEGEATGTGAFISPASDGALSAELLSLLALDTSAGRRRRV